MDNLGREGVFDPFDILRRNAFDGWWLDYGVLQVLLQVAQGPGHSVLDIGAGGGHSIPFFSTVQGS